MTGPFETEQQARELPAVRAVYEAFRADPGVGKMTPHNRRMLGRACEAAGVATGRYDDRIIEWLAGWEPQMCAVVAGLVTRAHEAGRAAAAEDTRRLGESRATVAAFDEVARILAAFDWEHDDRQRALEAIERVVLTGGTR